jgi:hypothetical protein
VALLRGEAADLENVFENISETLKKRKIIITI